MEERLDELEQRVEALEQQNLVGNRGAQQPPQVDTTTMPDEGPQDTGRGSGTAPLTIRDDAQVSRSEQVVTDASGEPVPDQPSPVSTPPDPSVPDTPSPAPGNPPQG